MGARDLEPGSPVKVKHEQDFEIAAQMVRAVRDEVIGKNWIPGAQKYAYAAVSSKLISENEASQSVQRTLKMERAEANAKPEHQKSGGTNAKTAGGAICGAAFN